MLNGVKHLVTLRDGRSAGPDSSTPVSELPGFGRPWGGGGENEVCQSHPTVRLADISVNPHPQDNPVHAQGCGDHRCRSTDDTPLPCVHLVCHAGNAECRRAESSGGYSQAIIFHPRRVRRPTGEGEFGLGQVSARGTTVAEPTGFRRTDSRLLHGQNQLAEEVQALHDFVSFGGIL
jgi:hypothetical protein